MTDDPLERAWAGSADVPTEPEPLPYGYRLTVQDAQINRGDKATMGLWLPETAQEKVRRAAVIALGTRPGDRDLPDLEPGDIVWYELDGRQYTLRQGAGRRELTVILYGDIVAYTKEA